MWKIPGGGMEDRTFMYSTITRPLYWIAMGLIYALIIAGARYWAQDLGLKMTWWKWMLTAMWYVLLSFSFASGFTLLGEREPRAGWYSLGFFLSISAVVGVLLWTLVL
jgi:hypothetical protein